MNHVSTGYIPHNDRIITRGGRQQAAIRGKCNTLNGGIMINNTMATELSVIVRGDEQLSDFSLGSRNLMVDVFGQVTFASGVIRGDLFFQYDPIFTRMAYSLQIQ